MAFNKQSILLMPSRPMLKRVPRDGYHVASYDNWLASNKLYTPANATASVRIDENNDQLFASLSLLKRNVTKPETKGINMSNKAIMFKLLLLFC